MAHTFTLTNCTQATHTKRIPCSLMLESAQPGLPAQQCFLHVVCLLGKHGSSWLYACSRNNTPLGTQGQAHLHAYDPGGRSHRHQPAAVERHHCQPSSGYPSRLVPWSDQNLHQHEGATCQPGLGEQRECRQSGGVSEYLLLKLFSFKFKNI